ncbi:MAG: T9SS type A sorting domain-containing protein, partial [Candidatus Poribacteria bacterium]|nr:T9SS type A sorting domain-containing protein [Candidatus Poribacteria bacterium]
SIWLWNVHTGEHIRTLKGDMSQVEIVLFSPDGKMLASGGGNNRDIRLWNAHTGEHIRSIGSGGSSLSFSPDGKTLASGGINGNVLLWNAQTGEHIRTLKGHTGWVSSLSFSPDGNTIASGSDNGTVLLWNLAPAEDADEAAAVAAPDVNGDGEVNIQDLVLVSSSLGQTGENDADVNGDGEVNIQDLVAVAAAIGEVAAAPAALRQPGAAHLTQEEVQHWLTQAQQANLTDATSVRGIRFLEQLLSAMIPKETALLPNYPNPFNPETWIPYQLAQTADVALTIYDIQGRVVRDLDLGHQRPGIYQSRTRAAYWDGRNAIGEPVSSGVYFYTLTAGDFTATRKLLIRK